MKTLLDHNVRIPTRKLKHPNKRIPIMKKKVSSAALLQGKNIVLVHLGEKILGWIKFSTSPI